MNDEAGYLMDTFAYATAAVWLYVAWRLLLTAIL
jgi:hypothetical protein